MSPSLVWTFITAIPDLIKLLQMLQKIIDQGETDRKVKDDLRSIHEAFDAKDPSRIAHIFNTAA